MIIGNLEKEHIYQCLSHEGFILKTGCFRYLIKSKISQLADNIFDLYFDYETINQTGSLGFNDFHIAIEIPNYIRKIFRKQAQFYFDGNSIVYPFPLQHATAILEWGMNWCISAQVNTYLIIHAAVIEKNGFAAILPAPPGSGKSTLCASLMLEGWRLLSDELTLIRLDNVNAVPIPRPVSLKNQSIEIIRNRNPQAVFGVVSSDTVKGTVCHLKPAVDSIRSQALECPIGWVIFPKYSKKAETSLTPKSKAQAFLEVADNSFNYSKLGETGFNVLKQVIDRADCYRFEYSNLDEAIDLFDGLTPPK